MQYNTTREKLIKPEYGRHIQKMVQHAMTLSSKDDRTKCAKAIVSFLVQSNNVSQKNIEEAEKKYWNQIHIISDFKLDVDSKYPLPEMEKLAKKPKKLSYPIRNIQFSFYGLSIEKMIKKAIETTDEKEKQSMVCMTANHMKKAYLSFNKDSVDNKTILSHLKILSKGQLSVPEDFDFIESKSVNKNKKPIYKKKFKKRK